LAGFVKNNEKSGQKVFYLDFLAFYDIIKTAAENSNICAARLDEDKI
jgi:hypothetical protein